MDKVRSKVHVKKRPRKAGKKAKRSRRSPYYDSDLKYGRSRDHATNKIVEYSDVSSQDFSAPEAGEIQDEENSVILSDREPLGSKNLHKNRDDVYDNSDNAKSAFASIASSSTAIALATTSTTSINKIIVGSPISSSVSSASPSKLSPIDNDDDKTDDSDLDQKRNKKSAKKAKKKKKGKKKAKKRRKSISSIENISESDFVVDEDDVSNMTPPLRTTTSSTSQSTWKKHYSTSSRQRSISPSPVTPPLRPNSTMSIYSESSRRTPPLATSSSAPNIQSSSSQKMYVSSPHTPPLSSKKIGSSSSYRSPDVEITSVGNPSYYHHSSHHSYHHHSRSPIVVKEPPRRSKSPGKQAFTHINNFFLCYILTVAIEHQKCVTMKMFIPFVNIKKNMLSLLTMWKYR